MDGHTCLLTKKLGNSIYPLKLGETSTASSGSGSGVNAGWGVRGTAGGTVLGMTAEDGMQTVEAEVPMAEMSSYTIDLRSMTQARGYFTCKFVRYEEAPGNVQQKVIEEAKALAEAE